MDLRIATYNVENLFTRPKAMNYVDRTVGDRALADIARLRSELARTTYRKAEILRLHRLVKEFVSVEAYRGKLFDRSHRRVVANGKRDWFGSLQLKREKFADQAQRNTAKVIRKVDADITCLVEVEDRPSLASFASDNSLGRYPTRILYDGNDQRGIDVALLSKFPVGGIWTHVGDKAGGRTVFSRDCLEVEVRVSRTTTVWMLLNHFKSKGYGATATSNARRKAQAQRVHDILLEEYDLRSDLVVVAGDLNDTRGSDPLSPLMKMRHLHDVLEEHLPDPADRWTYHFRSNAQIDYLLVSDPLRDSLTDAGVFRRGMFGVEQHSTSGERPYPSVTSSRTQASDHGAVWADFRL